MFLKYVHVSLCDLLDSEKSAKKEIEFFFPEFNWQFWKEYEEPQFQLGNVSYCYELGVHKVLQSWLSFMHFTVYSDFPFVQLP